MLGEGFVENESIREEMPPAEDTLGTFVLLGKWAISLAATLA